MLRARQSIRLRGYDYAQPGAYFVTICVQDRECLLGEVVSDEMRLSEAGNLVAECWQAIPDHFLNVTLDVFVVMPNHIHGIVQIERRGTACRAPTLEQFGRPVSGSLPTIIRSFKSAATKRVNQYRGLHGMALWQRNYYEHVIRNHADLHRIRQYIANNPLRWALDSENPNRQ